MSNQDIVENALLNCRRENFSMKVRCIIMHPDTFIAFYEEMLRNSPSAEVIQFVKKGWYKGIPIYRSEDLSSSEVIAY